MISILERYLLTQIVGGVVLALLVLAGLDAFISFLNELDEVGRGDYGFAQAGAYILYSLPMRIYEYAPTAVLIGSLLSLGGMAANNEVTAIRAAGLSIWGFATAILKIGIVFVIVILLIGEFLAPLGVQKGQQLKSKMLSDNAAVTHAGGVWVRHQDMFVKSNVILNDQTIIDLDIFRFNALNLTEVVHAGTAERVEQGWKLKNIQRLTIAENSIERTQAAQEIWPELMADNLFEVLSIEPTEMRARDLFTYIQYLEDNELDANQYKLAFWNRFIMPLSSLVMLMLALPFVFKSQRSGGAGQRLFVGVLLGIGYFLASRLLNQLGIVYGLPALIAAVAPPILFLMLAYSLIRRVN